MFITPHPDPTILPALPHGPHRRQDEPDDKRHGDYQQQDGADDVQCAAHVTPPRVEFALIAALRAESVI